MLGVCHRRGYGTAQDDIKAREYGTPNQVHRKTVLPLSCLGGCCATGVCSKQNQSGRIV